MKKRLTSKTVTEHLQQRAWTEGETTMAIVMIGGRTTGTLSVDERDDRDLL
jgi:hypothetical protein